LLKYIALSLMRSLFAALPMILTSIIHLNWPLYDTRIGSSWRAGARGLFYDANARRVEKVKSTRASSWRLGQSENGGRRGQKQIMIFSPKSGGTYIVEFRALGGESWLSACGSVRRVCCNPGASRSSGSAGNTSGPLRRRTRRQPKPLPWRSLISATSSVGGSS
jgi:hypothetical protein